MSNADNIDLDIMLGTDPDGAEVQLSSKAMLDATSDCIKILSVDGKLLSMNRAGCLALGVPEDSKFGMPWLPLLPAAVHESGQAALGNAASGRSARFQGQSVSEGMVRYWDNLLTPVTDSSGRVLSIVCVSRDVTANTTLKRELENAIMREKLLSLEMQHRVKNVFAIVGELISMSVEEAAQEDAPEIATEILRDKLRALSRASEAGFSLSGIHNVDEAKVDLGSLVDAVLRPYGNRYRGGGSEASVSQGNLTTIALFLHELATNSVKYGAFSMDGGHVAVDWSMGGNQALDLIWAESGGPPIQVSPRKQGFGNEMVDRIVRSVGGKVARIWSQSGLIAEMHLPNA
ncbi:MAG: PAS domain-containing protein [Hyphomicrobium sp.]|uniref:PAS domain-containing protein n=1 Tax=Hyphomicrobium sp. TaxID=82 RepID=UPI0039E58E28